MEGELETVKKAVAELTDASKSNDDGITALHNAICAEHFNVVRYLVEDVGADINAPDSDGWTPLHCAASAENVDIVKYLVTSFRHPKHALNLLPLGGNLSLLRKSEGPEIAL